MPRKTRSVEEEERPDIKKLMNEMTAARLEVFGANVAKYAEVLGAFRAALEKSGFSREESMQIILKVAEQPNRRPPFFWGGHWRKR